MMCDNEQTVYNCRLFDYSTGQHVTFYRRAITMGKKNENLTKAHHKEREEKRTTKQQNECRRISLSGTKNRIYNIARSNTWDWFITLTFDRNITDSSDYDTVIKKLSKYLNNFQQRYEPDMKYLIVPELHKDGVHYHFHGLLSNVEHMQFRFSGHFDNKDNPIYNIVNWKLGFTTATRVQDSGRVSNYITKYITKESEQYLKEKKRYYCSRNIERVKAEKFIQDEQDFQATYSDSICYCKTVNVKEAHQQINYYELQN